MSQRERTAQWCKWCQGPIPLHGLQGEWVLWRPLYHCILYPPPLYECLPDTVLQISFGFPVMVAGPGMSYATEHRSGLTWLCHSSSAMRCLVPPHALRPARGKVSMFWGNQGRKTAVSPHCENVFRVDRGETNIEKLLGFS